MVKIVRLTGCHAGTPLESGLDRYERPVISIPKFFYGVGYAFDLKLNPKFWIFFDGFLDFRIDVMSIFFDKY